MKIITTAIAGFILLQSPESSASNRNTTAYETKRNTVDVSCTSRRVDVNAVIVRKIQ